MDIKIVKVEGAFHLNQNTSPGSSSNNNSQLERRKTKVQSQNRPCSPTPILSTSLYQCQLCANNNKRTLCLSQENLDNHVRSTHGPLRFQCTVCHKIFLSSSYFKKHMLTHIRAGKKTQRFKCDICSQGFNKRSDLNDHIVKAHVFKLSGSQDSPATNSHEKSKFKCDLCPAVYNNQRKLESHVLNAHVVDKPFKCQICSKSFLEQQSLISHVKFHYTYTNARAKSKSKTTTENEGKTKTTPETGGKTKSDSDTVNFSCKSETTEILPEEPSSEKRSPVEVTSSKAINSSDIIIFPQISSDPSTRTKSQLITRRLSASHSRKKYKYSCGVCSKIVYLEHTFTKQNANTNEEMQQYKCKACRQGNQDQEVQKN